MSLEDFITQLKQVPDLSKGQADDRFEVVQKFLARFTGLGEYRSGLLDEASADALRRYQQVHGLDPTGNMDGATRRFMAMPRCGFPTVTPLAFKIACAWEKKNLTYAWAAGTPDVVDNDERRAVRRAFDTWQEVIDVNFSEVSSTASPDISIDWRTSANDSDFDMTGSVIAHADYPPKCSVVVSKGTLPLPIHFDEDVTWSLDGGTGTDVESVALHEIGHILGLDHSGAGTIMNDTFAGGNLRDLTQDDINGVLDLYDPRSRKGLIPLWKGVDADGRLFLSSSADGNYFTRQQVVQGTGGTGAHPSAVEFGSRLYMVWKGAGDDGRLFFSSSADGQHFSEQQILPGAGGTSHAPAVVALGGRLLVFWKGAKDDGRLFFNSSSDGVSFTNQQIVPGTGGSNCGPSAAVFRGDVYLAWKGAGSDGRLFYNRTLDGVTFSEQRVIPGTGGTSHTPALATMNGELYAVWKGSGGDGRLFFNRTGDGTNFSNQATLPGAGGTSHGPAAVGFKGRLFVFWKGSNTDQRLFYNSTADGASFTEQAILGGAGGSSEGPGVAVLTP